MLNKLEMDEKPLRAKKELLSEIENRHKSEQMELKDQFEIEIEKLRQIGLKRIEDNLKLLGDEKKELSDDIDELLNLQKRSRDLLALTSPHLIHDFKDVRKLYEEVIEKCEKALAANQSVKPCEFDNVKEILNKMGNDIDRELKTLIGNFRRFGSCLPSSAP